MLPLIYKPLLMVRLLKPQTAPRGWYAAVLGAAHRTSCVRRTVTGVTRSGVTSTSVSVLPRINPMSFILLPFVFFFNRPKAAAIFYAATPFFHYPK